MKPHSALILALIFILITGCTAEPTPAPTLTQPPAPTATPTPAQPAATATPTLTPEPSPTPNHTQLPLTLTLMGINVTGVFILDTNSTYFIGVESVPDASGYRWAISQNGELVFDSYAAGRLAGSSLYISRDSVPLSRLTTGAPANLLVQARIGEQWSTPTWRTIYFFASQDEYAAWPTPAPVIATPLPAASTEFGGAKIVFSDSAMVYSINADGFNEVRLANVGQPDALSVSDDGRLAAFSAAGTAIYAVNTDGTDLRPLGIQGDVVGGAALSPNGLWVAYMSNAAGRHQVHRQSWDFDLWVTSTTDSSQYRLVESTASVEWPAWSPDGITVAYVLLEDQGSEQAPQILPTLYTVKISTGEKTPVAQLPPGWVTGLTWSPDGRYLAFVSTGVGGAPRLYLIRANGSDLLPLTEAVVDAQAAPAWLPDSRHLYFDGSILDILTGEVVSFEPAAVQALRASGARLAGWSDPQGDDGAAVDCTQGWTHLTVGGTATVNTASNMPNRVRSGPSRSDAVITQILPGVTVRLLAGPVCADGLIFWQVESAEIPGGVGWTAEGDGVDHWLVP